MKRMKWLYFSAIIIELYSSNRSREIEYWRHKSFVNIYTVQKTLIMKTNKNRLY